ncbi:MAG: hypothetical protein QF357_00580 [Dehalococcoidia bacterium]|jgi:hypothetical protein|nr:hypothetical protein [Dehalococcoidia bacterium]
MPRRTLLISIALVLALVAAACGNAAAEPTTVPQTPTPVPIPTPVPEFTIITAGPDDIEGFLAQMPEADAQCLTASIGLERLEDLASGDGGEPNASEVEALGSCFSNEFVAGFMAGQIQAKLGSFSGSSSACVASLLDDLPERTLTELMWGTDGPQTEPVRIAIQGFVQCLTPAELTALSNLDDEDTAESGGPSVEYASRNEECMAGELGESFAAGYGGLLRGDLVSAFASAIELCGVRYSFDGLIASLEDTERKYTIADLTDVGFKKAETYDVRDLESASSVHYGFYGTDPYDRLEYEVRFYFTHAAASEIGVAFADEATGRDASLYADDQRWQEGLTERRRCDANGGHHVGRCGFPKYYDYVVAGNMVLMCEGRDTLESLRACADLLSVVQ